MTRDLTPRRGHAACEHVRRPRWSAPQDTEERASVSALASLLVVDRYQSKPGASEALSASTDLPTSSASVTVALVPESSTTRYGYGGHDDSAAFSTDVLGILTGYWIGLAGGTTLAFSLQEGVVYSHANLRGHTVTMTDPGRDRIWTGYTGPYGEPVTADPPNATQEETSWGWHGEQMRLSDRAIVHMGARPYAPSHGRFLAVDSVEGGCANDYAYAFGDPINESDLTGRSAGEFARCVLYETFGVAPPGRTVDASEAGRSGGVGPSSQGWEVNSRNALQFVATEVTSKAASLTARRVGPKWLASLKVGTKFAIKSVPVVGWGVTVGFAIRDAVKCRDRL